LLLHPRAGGALLAGLLETGGTRVLLAGGVGTQMLREHA